jgi:hypothetical protein
MKNINEYLRVGTDYYREMTIPMVADQVKILKGWSRQALMDDFGKDAINDIAKYDGFCFIPSHKDFDKVVGNHYNRYEPLSYPINEQGSWNSIAQFLKHIFGEQYDLGLDYLTILWNYPTQILPIFCLVSEERNTGKTTFLNLLKVIFEGNMTLNTNENFRSRFNSDWAGKLIIAIDEVLLEKRDDSERIKNLSTSKYYKAEAKGKDKVEAEFFGKFILCSNNEDSFIKVDRHEIRYWVRKVSSLGETVNPNLLDNLKKEVPAFANFLNNRIIASKKVSRMWFSKDQIHTAALDLLLSGNRTSIEKEVEEMLKDEFAVFELNELCYTPTNLSNMLKNRGFNASSHYIASILKTKYNLKVEKNSNYRYYRSEIYHESSSFANGFTNEKGRYYRFDKVIFAQL